MRIETGVTQLQWSLLLVTLTTLLYAWKTSYSVIYLLYNCPKEAQICPIPGLYSGIFVMYLQCHAFKMKADDNRKPTIVFYPLCVLYVLSEAVFSLEIANFWFDKFVSNNEHAFELCADQMYRSTTLVWHSALMGLFNPHYSVAATSSPSLSLYA